MHIGTRLPGGLFPQHMSTLRERVALRTHSVHDPGRRRRHRRLGLLLVAVGFVGLLALGLIPARAAQTQMEDGRDAMERARAAILEGDAVAATGFFREARANFERALELTRTPPLLVAGWIPLLSRTPDTVTAIARSAIDVARAGERITTAIEGLPGGLAALGPEDGAFDPAAFVALEEPMAEARRLVEAARGRVVATPSTLVLGAVVRARGETLDLLDELDHVLGVAGRLFDEVPSLLGTGSPARYFVAAQNPAELRGTGGLIGAYSILTVDDGRFDFGPFRPVQELPNFRPGEVEAPNPDYAANYDRFGGAGFWLNINMTPDFPSASQAILGTYEKATGERLDGVIAADPFALAALLRVSGPVDMAGLEARIGPENVVDFVTNEAYSLFEDQNARKLVLGRVAEGVFRRFMDRAEVASLTALARTAREGHITMYSADPQVEEGLRMAGVSGALSAPDGDVLAVIQNNGAGNKVDYYLEREVTYRVDLQPDGSARTVASVHLVNHAPDSGQPQYVIGPYKDISDAGEHISFTSVYCAAGCRLLDASRGGGPVEVYAGEELGLRLFQDYLAIPSGDDETVDLSLQVPDVWEVREGVGVYRLTYLGQTTINPTHLRVEVRLPPGTAATGAPPSSIIEGDRVIWEGDPGPRTEISISFRRLPAALRGKPLPTVRMEDG